MLCTPLFHSFKGPLLSFSLYRLQVFDVIQFTLLAHNGLTHEKGVFVFNQEKIFKMYILK